MRNFKLIALTASLGLGIAWGCGESLSELLLDALCQDDGDCAPSQNCYKTSYQVAAVGGDETLAQGWCRDDNSCAAGAQPGCPCLQAGSDFSCTPTTEPDIRPDQQSTECECRFRCDSNQANPACPGILMPSTADLSDPSCVCE